MYIKLSISIANEKFINSKCVVTNMKGGVEEITNKFEKKVKEMEEYVRQKWEVEFAEFLLEDFKTIVEETWSNLVVDISDLDLENCDACKHFALNYLKMALEELESTISCYEKCEGYFRELYESDDEVEPPCTSFCPIIQYKRQLSFNIVGNNEWYLKEYGHAPNCKFANS